MKQTHVKICSEHMQLWDLTPFYIHMFFLPGARGKQSFLFIST